MLTFIRGQDLLQAVDKFVRIEIPALPRPTIEAVRGERRPWIKTLNDTSPTGPVILRLARPLRADEESISETKYRERIRLYHTAGILPGYQDAFWLKETNTNYPNRHEPRFKDSSAKLSSTSPVSL